MILADRNLDTDEDGRLNGRLLHRTTVVLIDFSAPAGRRVRLVNRGGLAAGVPDPAASVPFPQVMEFRGRETGRRDEFIAAADR